MNDRIGPYVLVDKLGEGGMGVVYVATRVSKRVTDDSELSRQMARGERFALKTLRMRKGANPLTIRREIDALARIRHPGVVRILEYDMQAETPWYAMALLTGAPLRSWLSGEATTALDSALLPTGRMGNPGTWTHSLTVSSAAVAADLDEELKRPDGPTVRVVNQRVFLVQRIREAAWALAYLHGHGVVHADLKPENIVIVDDDTWGARAVLVDFGLSMRVLAGRRESLQVSTEVAGTPWYMAPEQATGEDIDARADIYALGCILYEALSGQPPFTGKTPFKVLTSHVHEVPADIRTVADDVPPILAETIMSMLAKAPGERPAYAEDVARRLGQALRDWGEDPTPLEGPTPTTYLYRPAFVGRADALQLCSAQLDATSEGTGGVTVLLGPAGVGKTRLAREVMDAANARGLRVIAASCEANASSPIASLRDTLVAQVKRCAGRGRGMLHSLLDGIGPILTPHIPWLNTLAEVVDMEPAPLLPPRESLGRVQGALAVFWDRCVELMGPQLLVIDDVQWADAVSFNWLLEQTGGTSALRVLVTLREEDLDESLERLTDLGQVVRIDPLGNGDIVAIVGNMLGLSWGLPAFAEQLAASSGGSPLLVSEVLRTAVAELQLTRTRSGQWTLQGEMALLTDGGLEALIETRLASLSTNGRELVELAATLGRVTALPLLETHVGDRLMAALDEAMARDIVELGIADNVRFVHETLRDVIRKQMSAEKQQQNHLAAAELLVERGRPDDLARIGRHLANAGHREAACEAYLAAADRARELNDLAGENELLSATLDQTTVPSAATVRLRLRWIDNAKLIGDLRQVLEQAEAAEAEARAVGDPALELDALLWHVSAYHFQGDLKQAFALAHAAERLAEGMDHPMLEARLHRQMAFLLCEISEHADAEQRAGQARQLLGEDGDPLERAGVASVLARVHLEQGRYASARRELETSLGIYRGLGNVLMEVHTMVQLGSCTAETGDIAGAEALLSEGIQRFRALGSQSGAAMTRTYLGIAYLLAGRSREAREVLEESLSWFAAEGDRIFEAMALDWLAMASGFDGAWSDARDLAARGMAIHQEMEDRFSEGLVLGMLGWFDLGEDRLLEARAGLANAAAVLAEVGDQFDLVRTLVRASDVERRLGDLVAARQLLARATAAGDALESRLVQISLKLQDAQLALAEQDLERCAALLGGLAEVVDETTPVFAGQLACLQAELAVASGADGEPFLATARDIVRAQGYGPDSELARRCH